MCLCVSVAVTVLPVHLPLFPPHAPFAAIPWQTFYQLIFLLLSLSDKTFIKLPRFANPQHSERPFRGCFGAAPNSRTPTHIHSHTRTKRRWQEIAARDLSGSAAQRKFLYLMLPLTWVTVKREEGERRQQGEVCGEKKGNENE